MGWMEPLIESREGRRRHWENPPGAEGGGKGKEGGGALSTDLFPTHHAFPRFFEQIRFL